MRNFGSSHLPIHELSSHSISELNDSTQSDSDGEDFAKILRTPMVNISLRSSVDPLEDSDVWGVDFFVITLSVMYGTYH